MTVAFCGGLGYVQQRGEASGGGCKSADSKQALLLVMGGSSPPAEPKSSIDGQEHLMGCFSSSNPHHHQKAPISPKFPRNHLVAAARLQHCFCTSWGWKSNAKRALVLWFFCFFFFPVVPGHITGRCVCSAKPPVSCFTNGTSLQVLAGAVR